jgi:membrane protein implicated in regulation of membrane protease activity
MTAHKTPTQAFVRLLWHIAGSAALMMLSAFIAVASDGSSASLWHTHGIDVAVGLFCVASLISTFALSRFVRHAFAQRASI